MLQKKMFRDFKAFLSAGLILSLLAVSPATGAKNKELITMDFNNADIVSVIKFISELTGKNFLIDEKVRGKVTVISPKKISVDEAYHVFESILEVYGYTAVPTGEVIKILPLSEAKHRGVETIGSKGEKASGDRVITRLMSLKFIDSDTILPIIRPILSKTSYATSYSPANTLIVTDLASNINKLLKIIKNLDVEGRLQMPVIEIVKLNFSYSKIMAPRLEDIFKAKTAALASKSSKSKNSKGDIKIFPDDRTNSLIVVAAPEYMKGVKGLIAALDTEPQKGQGRINVYKLNNANAEELAKVLERIISDLGKSGAASGKKAKAELQEKVKITADSMTNSLVIVASLQDYETIRNVIEQLDVRSPQVFVEAMIMEISTNVANSFGIEWRTTTDFTEPGTKGLGGTNFGGISDVAVNPLSGQSSGLVLGVVDGTISYGGEEFLNMGALMRALQQDSEINILSTPNILTTDNEEAEIMVGENIPITVGSTATPGGQVTENIQRTDVGLILRIKPQINESDYVKLNIYQEISGISPTSTDLTNPITTKRTAKTTVIVKDGQNVVIGGLMKDDLNEVVSKVPILGDIPLLGWFFKYKSKEAQKTNLLIFISPHIVRNDQDIEKISRQKRIEMRAITSRGKKKKKKKIEEEEDIAGGLLNNLPVDVDNADK